MDLGKRINLYHKIPLVNLENSIYKSIKVSLIDNIDSMIKWPNYDVTIVVTNYQIATTILDPYNE